MAKRKPPITPSIQHPPALRTGKVELEYREGTGYLWPEAVPPPGRWHIRLPIPCAACARVYMADRRQAVICRFTDGGVAYLVCRACKHTFKLPITRV